MAGQAGGALAPLPAGLPRGWTGSGLGLSWVPTSPVPLLLHPWWEERCLEGSDAARVWGYSLSRRSGLWGPCLGWPLAQGLSHVWLGGRHAEPAPCQVLSSAEAGTLILASRFPQPCLWPAGGPHCGVPGGPLPADQPHPWVGAGQPSGAQGCSGPHRVAGSGLCEGRWLSAGAVPATSGPLRE